MTKRPAPRPERKGAHRFVWVAVGCTGVVFIGFILLLIAGSLVSKKVKEATEGENPVILTARVVAAMNPDIEVIEADEERGVVIFRNNKTGEEHILDFEDIEQGRIRFYSEDDFAHIDLKAGEGNSESNSANTPENPKAPLGEGIDISNFPSWLPLYPGTEPYNAANTGSAEEREGFYFASTKDDPQEVLDYYVTELRRRGFEIARRPTMMSRYHVEATSREKGLSASVTLSVTDERVMILVEFSEKSGSH